MVGWGWYSMWDVLGDWVIGRIGGQVDRRTGG